MAPDERATEEAATARDARDDAGDHDGEGGRRPLIWALLSHRSGESQQILGLAEALQRHGDWALRVVTPAWTPLANPLGLLRRTSLAGMHGEVRRALGARSPDLVISAGLRNEPIVRWLAARSRGRTVTVMLGRTWAAPSAFDLVVTTPQYRLPPDPHVLENPGTLHRISAPRLAAARAAFAEQFAPSRAPRLGLLVGGDSGPHRLGARAAERLAKRARELAGEGTVLATTSSRTPQIARHTLATRLSPDDLLWQWDDRGENPYFGILAWADALLVTGDSIAMVSEAVATGKPVRIFDPGGMRRDRQPPRDHTLRSLAYGLLMRLGPRRLSRDLGRVHAGLIEAGLAAWDDVPLQGPVDRGEVPADHMTTTMLRVRALVAGRRA
ncbi:MAG TPA: ELM1/GtrOC1 family putative glycosyltransferase [Pseudomonadales bacterium]|nr:ELM1/GtrOC1 family putative glycosyltransferase [Pseudomonadales bacterium]